MSGRSGRKGRAEQERRVREKNYIRKRKSIETGEREGNVKGEKERRWRKCRRS